MSINVRDSDILEIGEQSKVVSSVRDTTISDELLMRVLKIKLDTIKTIRFVITKHPDWDDADVAEEVLDLQDEGFDVDRMSAEME